MDMCQEGLSWIKRLSDSLEKHLPEWENCNHTVNYGSHDIIIATEANAVSVRWCIIVSHESIMGEYSGKYHY